MGSAAIINHLLFSQPEREKWTLRGKTLIPTPTVAKMNLLFLELFEVSPVSNKSTKRNLPSFSPVTFVALSIPPDRREECKTWCMDNAEEIPTLMLTYTTDGYKFSLKWDDENNCFIASFTGAVEGHPNYQKCLSSRAGDWIEAILLSMWKTEFLCVKGVWDTEVSSFTWG